MPDITGYVSVRNKCGTRIEDLRLSVSVDGTPSQLLQLNLLSDGMTSMNKKFILPSKASADWSVSFTYNSTQMVGTATCALSTADNNQMLKITVHAGEFILAPAMSDNVTGRYGS